MKNTVTAILRIILGLIFLVFGLNGFAHFFQPPAPAPAGMEFFGALIKAGYMIPLVFGAQVAGGILLLLGFVALGVVILAPVVVNIVCFHFFLDPNGIAMAIAVAVMELVLVWNCREAFAPLLRRT